MKKKLIGNEKLKVIENNFSVLKMAFSFSRRLVIHSFIRDIINYLLLVFYSTYFVKLILSVMEKQYSIAEIIWSIGLIGLVTLLIQMYIYKVGNLIMPVEDVKLYQGVYEQVYHKSENLELSCYIDKKSREKFTHVFDGMYERVKRQISSVSNIVGCIAGGIFVVISVIVLDFWMMPFLFAPIVGNFIIAPRLKKVLRQQHAKEEASNRFMSYMDRVMYIRSYAKDLRISNVYSSLEKKYMSSVEEKSSLWKQFFKPAFWYDILQYLCNYFIVFEGVLAYGAFRIMVTTGSSITFSTAAVLTALMMTASWILIEGIHSFDRCEQASQQMENEKEFFEYEEKVPQNQDGIAPTSQLMSIDFCDVTFSYDGVHNILEHISFKIVPGSNVAIVGRSETGKTTLLMLLMRFYDPTDGVILVNNIDIRFYNLKKYREMFACAFQKSELFPHTVRYNVLVGRNVTDFAVVDALTMAGVYDQIKALPKGIDTVLSKEYDEEGVILSTAEQKKIAIARVMANPAPIMLFDEPTSKLESAQENELCCNIVKRSQGRTCIFVSHRLSCTKNVSTILMLEGKTIIEKGTHEELLRLNGEYAKMYRIQETYHGLYEEAQDEVTV